MRFHEQVMGVYFDDLDPFQILHNARYLLLFERTLGSFWMELGLGGLQDAHSPEPLSLRPCQPHRVPRARPRRGQGAGARLGRAPRSHVADLRLSAHAHARGPGLRPRNAHRGAGGPTDPSARAVDRRVPVSTLRPWLGEDA